MLNTSDNATVTTEEVKSTLKNYSHFLRRDFLAILVKMAAKQLNIRTVRGDWRTRKGMIAFLQSNWKGFTKLLQTDTIFNWYTTNFESAEKFFMNRKFMLYIQLHWNNYSKFFKSQATIAFIKAYQNNIEQLLNGNKQTKNQWATTETGETLIKIIEAFKSGIRTNNFTEIFETSTEEEEVPAKVEEEFVPQKVEEIVEEKEESDISSPEPIMDYDNIVLEDSIEMYPFELWTVYDSRDLITVQQMEDPFTTEDFSI